LIGKSLRGDAKRRRKLGLFGRATRSFATSSRSERREPGPGRRQEKPHPDPGR